MSESSEPMGPLVSRGCQVLAPGRPIFFARVGVFRPTQVEGKWWQCKLSLPGIVDDERVAFGCDEWDALQAGMQMVWIELDHKARTGWTFTWWNGESSDVNQLLPHWGRELHPRR
ncbi:hypothetical protein OU994_20175 [Pseudoduganella sp. SL102]|uniref:DUF6968 family protein n=1 Tax=Pseudoduganella sp. SL102 TaxID=2995154 RepID=UPI00248D2726|nr:hypothetical protein [Pseudoduganella sp. SL102]WBS00626.1 hypothetical protein OU994_20175 [Pseudoduganella sp. SL102]